MCRCVLSYQGIILRVRVPSFASDLRAPALACLGRRRGTPHNSYKMIEASSGELCSYEGVVRDIAYVFELWRVWLGWVVDFLHNQIPCVYIYIYMILYV